MQMKWGNNQIDIFTLLFNSISLQPIDNNKCFFLLTLDNGYSDHMLRICVF